MIKQLLQFAAIGVSLVALGATDNPPPQELLSAAGQQIALLENAHRPFLMDVDFTAKFDAPRQGHLRIRWEARERWWSKLTVAQYEQIKFQKSESTWTLRNVSFTPTQVHELFDLVHVGMGYDQRLAKKVKQRLDKGVTLDCIEAQPPEANWEKDEVCVNDATHDVVRETRNYGAGGVTKMQFSDFVEFAGIRYPRRLEFAKEGITVITANVLDLKESPLDPDLLVPPEGAIERRECKNEKAPVLVNHPSPNFHDAGVASGSTASAEITVLANGTVGEVHLIASGGKRMDAAFLDSLKTAKFNPAMCGTEPVVADMQMSVTFTSQ